MDMDCLEFLLASVSYVGVFISLSYGFVGSLHAGAAAGIFLFAFPDMLRITSEQNRSN